MFRALRGEKTEQGVRRTREAWFGKVAHLLDRSRVDEGLWDELEELLILADVGVDTTSRLLERVKGRTGKERITQGYEIKAALNEETVSMLTVERVRDEANRPGLKVILMVGVNGSGKTTSIAKLANIFKMEGKRTIIAAADTFRAAAIDQLKLWGERIGVEVICHQPGGDPGAVVFDAIQAARSRGADVVIVDTAGRLHTKFNLMEELKKIKRVVSRADPDAAQEVLLVMDATTGQNGLAQARHFADAVGVDGILLAKLDSTAKGGIVLAISDELRIPVLYIGTGEGLVDIAPFDPEAFVEALYH